MAPKHCERDEIPSALIQALQCSDGEASGIRTRDPVIKSHMLYQLSYRPKSVLSILYKMQGENKPIFLEAFGGILVECLLAIS